MTAAGLRREIGRMADLCERHCRYAEQARDERKPGAALAHAQIAGDYADKAKALAVELAARLAQRPVHAVAA